MSRAVGVRVPDFFTNPEGIVPFSPGLPHRGYPGKKQQIIQPQRGCVSEVIAVDLSQKRNWCSFH